MAQPYVFLLFGALKASILEIFLKILFVCTTFYKLKGWDRVIPDPAAPSGWSPAKSLLEPPKRDYFKTFLRIVEDAQSAMLMVTVIYSIVFFRYLLQ